MGASLEGFNLGFRASKIDVYCIDLTHWVAGGRAVPPDVREEPGGALYVHFPYTPPIVLPSTGVKADVYPQCLTTLVMGGKGLSRPGGNLGFRV